MVRLRKTSTSSETSTDSWSVVENQTVVSSVSLDSEDEDSRRVSEADSDIDGEEADEHESYESDLELEDTGAETQSEDEEAETESEQNEADEKQDESENENENDSIDSDQEEEDTNMCLIEEEEAMAESQARRFVSTTKIVNRLDQLADHYDSLYDRLWASHPRPVFLITVALSAMSALTVAQLIQYTCLSHQPQAHDVSFTTGLQSRWASEGEWDTVAAFRSAALQCRFDFLLNPSDIAVKDDKWPLPNMSIDAATQPQIQVQVEQHTFEEFERLKSFYFYAAQLREKRSKTWTKEAPTSSPPSKFKNNSDMCHFKQAPVYFGPHKSILTEQSWRKYSSPTPCLPKIYKPTVIKKSYPQTPCKMADGPGPIPPPTSRSFNQKIRRNSSRQKTVVISLPETASKQLALTFHEKTHELRNQEQCQNKKIENDVEKLLKLVKNYDNSKKASEMMRKRPVNRREYCTKDDMKRFKPTYFNRLQLAHKKRLPCVPMKNRTKPSGFSMIERKPTLPAKLYDQTSTKRHEKAKKKLENDWQTERAREREERRREEQTDNWQIERARQRAETRRVVAVEEEQRRRGDNGKRADWFTVRSKVRAQARAN